MANESILKMNEIVKTFPGVVALNNVSLDVRKGEIHALIGENGAGKSTLMKVLNGLYQPDHGSIEIDGKTVVVHDRQHAKEHGVSMIFQELSVLPNMDVASNILLANEPKLINGKYLVDKKEMNRLAQQTLDLLGINLKPTDMVSHLSSGQQQLVEIARAITTNAKIIVMDEPTTSLNSHETELLFKTIRSLKEQGKAIIYISHRLEELLDLADRATVLRDGNKVAELNSMKDTCHSDIIELMVGHSTKAFDRCKEAHTHHDADEVPVLEVRHLSSKDHVKDVSFKLYRGEIVGVTGLIGSGRSELVQLIYGSKKSTGGEILVDGQPVRIKSPRDAMKIGIGYVSDDRKNLGIIPPMNVEENISLNMLNLLSSGGVLNKQKIKSETDDIIKQLAIKIPSKSTPIYKLSGGNQQKCLIGRWLIDKPKILIMNEPTQGVDVGVKAELYRILDEMTKQGIAVLFVSQDFAELVEVSDRIIALYKGRVQGELAASEVNDAKIMNFVTGG